MPPLFGPGDFSDAVDRRYMSDLIMSPVTSIAVILSPLLVLTGLYVLKDVSGYRVLSDYSEQWRFAVLIMEAFVVTIIINRLYKRLVSHSKRDRKWRRSLIGYAESKGADTKMLRRIDDECRTDDHFPGRIPAAIIMTVLFAILLFSILFYGKVPSFWRPFLPIAGLVLAILMFITVIYTVLSYPSRHEQGQVEFTEELTKVLGAAGMSIRPMKPVIVHRGLGIHIILLVVTCGIYLIYLLYRVFKMTNDHLMNQWVYESELLRAMNGAEDCFTDPVFAPAEDGAGKRELRTMIGSLKRIIRRENRMPVLLMVAEIFIVVLCISYMLKLVAVEGDIMLNPEMYDLSDGLSMSAIVSIALVPLNIFLLMFTIDSLLGIKSRKPTSWRKVTRSCFTFVIPLWISALFTKAGGILHMFDFNVYITTAVLYDVLLIMILSDSVRRFYTPMGKEIGTLAWMRFIVWGKLEDEDDGEDV